MHTNFPRGNASILIRKTGLAVTQCNALLRHMEYARAHFQQDEIIYRWWNSEDNYALDAWHCHDNYGRIFFWTAYDNFNLNNFIVKLLGPSLAREIWMDSWHSCYAQNLDDPYFEMAQIRATT